VSAPELLKPLDFFFLLLLSLPWLLSLFHQSNPYDALLITELSDRKERTSINLESSKKLLALQMKSNQLFNNLLQEHP